MGAGEPIVFLHGNPTSSYLWRNVMSRVIDLGRCIAFDLVGMGDSEKLDDSGPDRYTFAEHSTYLDAAIDALGIEERVALVVHDWGSALGFHWANRNRDAVRGICYMEAIVRPMTWDEFPEAARGVFQGFRSPAGEQMVLEKNLFVEAVLPGSILRTLSDAEMDEYRRPFSEPGESRRPTLTWPRADSHRWRAGGCSSCRAGLCRLALPIGYSQTLRQCRAGCVGYRRRPGILPGMAEPDGDYGEGQPFSSRRTLRSRSAKRSGVGCRRFSVPARHDQAGDDDDEPDHRCRMDCFPEHGADQRE